MSFILDTCTLSELSKPRPDANVVGWFEVQDEAALFLSALTVGELERGVAALSKGRKKAALAAWLGGLRGVYADRILAVDVAVAALWGQITARLEADGSPLSVVDGLIASTALHHGFAVVTRNVADFERTGVALVDPWQV